MILQALSEYYNRLSNDPDSSIAPLGWEKKEIPFFIVLDKEGNVVQIEDTREKKGKKLLAKSFLIPQSVKRSSGVAANLLWDNIEYVTGIVCDEDAKSSFPGESEEKRKEELKKQEKRAVRVREQHQAFIDRIDKEVASVQSVLPVSRFLSCADLKDKLNEFGSVWNDAVTTNAFISFKIVGHPEPVFREPDVIAKINALRISETFASKRRCIDGTFSPVAKLHPAIKGVYGTNTTGGNIVSFNADAFRSFGKNQGDNAPVGEEFAFRYTTALNTLLSKDSRQKLSVGDATMVFWASKSGEPLEDTFIDIFSEPAKGEENVSEEAIARLFNSVKTGAYKDERADTRFYVLGLSPNAARISIRFWQVGTVAEMEERFKTWFEDLRIAHGPNEKEDLSLWRLLLSTAAQRKTENISPNLAGNIMRSILEGSPLPETLLGTLLVRFKSDHDLSYTRMKLIKGYLIRKWRFYKNGRSLTVSLDKNNTNTGYRLGRLFAVLEKIQQEANPGINATIRDKFYAAASSTPASVFGNLMRLKNHHLSKLDSQGREIYFERLLGEIIYQSEDQSGISKFPAHLNLDDQGMFAIGYYHQRQDFFTKKDGDEEKKNPDNK